MLTQHWAAAKGMKATSLTTTIDNLSTYYLFYSYTTLGSCLGDESKRRLLITSLLLIYFMLTRHWAAAQGAERGTPTRAEAILLTTKTDSLSTYYLFYAYSTLGGWQGNES
jgi:hypothetical protein